MHLLQQRRLSGDTYQETKNMLSVKAMIQQHIHRNNGSMSLFPIVASKEHKLAIKATLNVYCCCRLPYALDHLQLSNVPADDTTEMVKCAWYL